VLFAATGSTFIICRIDPFIPIFRISGSLVSLLLSAAFLAAALFVGRPYCRFLCPYGALLKLAAGVARWRVRVTPDFCTQCKLCAESCPFGVIAEPSTAVVTPKSLPVERRRFLALLALLPVLVVVGGFTGVRFGEVAARVNPNVRLAAQFIANQNGADLQFSDKADELAFIRAQHSAAALLPVAEAALQRFRVGGAIFGAWVGLVIGARLLAFAAGRKRTDYEPERTGCFACARCFSFCPQERVRLGLPVDSPVSAKAA
jgi:ferredoxin